MSELKETYRQIGRASALMIVLTLFDKILALAKEIMVADRFGISDELDVFNIASAVPGIVLLVFYGAMVGAFVPLYLEWTYTFSKRRADRHALSLLAGSVVFFGMLACVCYLLAPHIIAWVGYGFMAREQALGIMMERLLVLLIAVDGAGIIMVGLLEAQKRFFSLSISQMFVTATMIAFLILFPERLGIFTLVWGILLGTCLKVAYLALVLRCGGFVFFTRPAFRRPVAASFLWLALPLLGSELISNVNLLVDQVMATKLASGSVSTLRYAYRVNNLPIQIIFLAVARAIFPFISDYAARRDEAGLQAIFKQSVVFLKFITFPIMVLIVLFSREIVALLFERGAFDAAATRQTAQTLLCYALGLFLHAYSFVNGTFFSALKNNKPLFYVGCLSIILNVALNYIFMHFFGVVGIALSTTITLGVVASIFLLLLRQKLQRMDFAGIFSNVWRIMCASAVMLAVGVLLRWGARCAGMHQLLYLPVLSFMLGAVYLAAVWCLKTDDLAAYLKYMMRRAGL